jgi:hypothetical protein
MELRMYGFTPYQLTGIQKGIQFLHGVVKYGQLVKKLIDKYPNSHEIIKMNGDYNEWADKWQTVILLNGGTTNKNFTNIGTLNQHLEELKKNGIVLSEMYEPDLGDQLTAVVFIVDEKVFNKKDYPEFIDYVITNGKNIDYTEMDPAFITYEKFSLATELEELELARDWRDLLGGDKNVFLRGFLQNFRLA